MGMGMAEPIQVVLVFGPTSLSWGLVDVDREHEETDGRG